jgi:hypothetical protein
MTLRREQISADFQRKSATSRDLPEAVNFATHLDEPGDLSQNPLGIPELLHSRMDDQMNRVSYHRSQGLLTNGRRSGGRWLRCETADEKRNWNLAEDADPESSVNIYPLRSPRVAVG